MEILNVQNINQGYCNSHFFESLSWKPATTAFSITWLLYSYPAFDAILTLEFLIQQQRGNSTKSFFAVTDALGIIHNH